MALIAYVYWNTRPELLKLGPLTVRWYGVLFALLFWIGFFIVRWQFRTEGKDENTLGSLLTYLVTGTIVGARLGHCLFYEPAYYLSHPLAVFRIWEGGLASHGGAVGVLIALYLYCRHHPDQPYLWLLDRIAVPTALGGCFIRLGNLFNSEILGLPTKVPWAFVFAREDLVPRHPAQLYESISYAIIFVMLLLVYSRLLARTPRGLLVGLFLVSVFTARFLIEFVKERQSAYGEHLPLSVGQLLSLPFCTLRRGLALARHGSSLPAGLTCGLFLTTVGATMKESIDSRRQFASDNNAGIAPEAWAALSESNTGHAVGYGDDAWTKKASDQIREIFETNCEIFFVFNGTAANSLSLAALCQSYHSILCHEIAHVETDECGAPEFFSNGTKVLLVSGENGKIDPVSIERMVKRRTDIHYPKPRVVSVTQATEIGTLYTPEELKALGDAAHRLGLKVHMDGARFANAVAALDVAPREITWEVGVDVLCFGGTKNGTPVGDAVVFFDPKLAYEFDYRCKQSGQLASKMRFLAAPWVGMLQNNAWLNRASHANAMAQLLFKEIKALPGVSIMFPCQANSVFVQLPDAVANGMRSLGWRFYNFIAKGGCRLMCSWDTTEEDVRRFAADLKSLLGSS